MKSNEAIQLIKSRLPISVLVGRYVELRRLGNRLMAPCPFHQETKPSFSVNEDMGTFYCFGCQASGDIFEFVMRMNGWDFREALEHFAEELGISLTQSKMTLADKDAQKNRQQKRDFHKMHTMAASHYQQNLKLKEATACNAYIEKRGLSSEIINQFQLGYSQDSWNDLSSALKKQGFSEEAAVHCGLLSQKNPQSNCFDRFRGRLMFPIFSLTGQVLAFGGRLIPPDENAPNKENVTKQEEAKYINSSDSPIYKKGEHLYGLYQARKAMSLKQNVLLTEGYMDVLTLHQFGFDNAIAVLGTALTDIQVKRISGFCSKAELLFDGDRAGRQAAFRSAQMLLLAGLECKVVLFPEKEDIDSLLRLPNGLELFAKQREKAEEGLTYLVRSKREISLLEAITWAKDFLSHVQIPEIISKYATFIAGELGIDEAQIRLQIKQSTTRISRHSKPDQGAGNTINGNTKDLQRDRLLLTFAVRYPQSISKLTELGMDLILKTSFAREYWQVLISHQPDSIFNFLSSYQKQFWIQCREGNAPPCNDEIGEFNVIKQLLANYHAHTQKISVRAALQQGKPDTQTQREYLNALQEELGRKSEH